MHGMNFLVSILLLSPFFPHVACAPRATRIHLEVEDRHALNLKYSLEISLKNDEHIASTKPSENLSRRGAQYSDSDTTPFLVSETKRVIPVVVPLISVFSVLLLLLLLKMAYLKQRRLLTIHKLPSLLTPLPDDGLENMSGHLSPCRQEKHRSLDIHSLRSQDSSPASRRSSAATSNYRTSRNSRQIDDLAPGILVGLLGSPEWETKIQREIAKHEWNLRRNSRRSTLNSQHRHTWHSPAYTMQTGDYTGSPRSGSGVTGRSAEQCSDQRLGRHSSLRIPHISCSGEMISDTFWDKRQRPKSLNAVMDQMTASQSISTLGLSPATKAILQRDSYGNESGASSGFPSSLYARSQRPSTINEMEASRPSPSLGNNTAFHFRVTDFGDTTCPTTVTVLPPPLSTLPAPVDSMNSGLGSESMDISSSYGRSNRSKKSSIEGSWRQLPRFPSPPASPFSPPLATPKSPEAVEVNAVCFEPHYFDESCFKGVISTKSATSRLLDVTGCGLGITGKEKFDKSSRFSPLTLDFGWPALSDLLVSDLLNLMHPTPVEYYKSANSAQFFPSPLESIPNRKEKETLTTRDQSSTSEAGFLSVPGATVLNRHHSRVREHVPFSLVTPPPAYLKSPRLINRTVRFSAATNEMDEIDTHSPSASLVNLSIPVRPSPLRRVLSLDSARSSRASSRSTQTFGSVSKDATDATIQAISVILGNTRQAHYYEERTCERTAEPQVEEAPPSLRLKSSHASLFLDLGGSSTALADEQSEFYSFDTAEIEELDLEYSIWHSQASSSGILCFTEECSDEDIEYIVEIHSESFPDMKHEAANEDST